MHNVEFQKIIYKIAHVMLLTLALLCRTVDHNKHHSTKNKDFYKSLYDCIHVRIRRLNAEMSLFVVFFYNLNCNYVSILIHIHIAFAENVRCCLPERRHIWIYFNLNILGTVMIVICHTNFLVNALMAFLF